MEDYPHLQALCNTYGPHTAPIQELRDACVQDGIWTLKESLQKEYPMLPELSTFECFKKRVKDEDNYIADPLTIKRQPPPTRTRSTPQPVVPAGPSRLFQQMFFNNGDFSRS